MSKLPDSLTPPQPESLNKGLGTALTLAAGLALGGTAQKSPGLHYEIAKQVTQTPWTPEGLHPEMTPIVHLESSWGQNMNHVPNPRGEFNTAQGAMGLKPETGHERYLQSKQLQAKYPNLQSPEAFTNKIKTDHKFYNEVAGHHWEYLKHHLGTPERAAFGWRHGLTASKNATPEQVAGDEYVQRFTKMSKPKVPGTSKTETTDSEPLEKMAIRDLKPGAKLPSDPYTVKKDYTHLITNPLLRKQYQLTAHHSDTALGAELSIRDTGQSVGLINGGMDNGAVNTFASNISAPHRGKGLGKAMYEALLAHAFHHLGARRVEGDSHSSMAHNVHSSLSEKHGFEGYEPDKIGRAQGPNDEAYGPYDYTMKSEPLHKADQDVRTLMDSSDKADWFLALKKPEVTSDDLSYLLGKLKSVKYDGVPTRLPENIIAHPALNADHITDIIDTTVSANNKTKAYSYLTPELVRHPQFNSSHMDQMVNDLKDWTMTDVKGNTERITNHPTFTPRHFDKLLDGIKNNSKILQFEKFTDRPTNAPEDIDRWMDWGIKNKEIPASNGEISPLVQKLAKHPKLSDKSFIKLMNSDHPHKTDLQFRQMSDSQLKSFLSDPKFNDTTSRRYDSHGRMLSDVLARQDRVSQENAELASRSPHPGLRMGAADLSSNPDTLRRLGYDTDMDVRSQAATNKNMPPEVLHEMAGDAVKSFQQTMGDTGSRDWIEAIAKNPSTSSETLDYLADKDNTQFGGNDRQLQYLLRQRVVKHPNLSQAAQKVIARDEQHLVPDLLSRPDIHPEIVRGIFNDPNQLGSNLDKVLTNPKPSQHLTSDDLRNWTRDGSSSMEGIKAGFAHPNMPVDVLESVLTTDDPGMQGMAARNPQIGPDRLTKFLSDPKLIGNAEKEGATNISHHQDADVLNGALENPNITTGHLEQLAGVKAPQVQEKLLHHPKATDDTIRKIWQNHKKQMHLSTQNLESLAGNPRTPSDVIDEVAQDETVHSFIRGNALDHPAISDDVISKLANKPPPPPSGSFGGEGASLINKAKEIHSQRFPDENFEKELPGNQVHVKLGTGKLRKIRDAIWAKSPDRGEVKPKDLPAGDWSAGRLPNGNISAAKLQQHIDSLEPIKFNTSEGHWTGAQRHSDKPSNVFQLNLSNEHVKKMRAAGVYGTFLDMLKNTQSAGHPVRLNHSIGWVRHTGTPETGIHIDEIQSDFGQKWGDVARREAREAGRDEDEAGAAAEQRWPQAHQDVIKNILFQGRHPNEVIGEAFVQRQRDLGHIGSKIAIHDSKTKAPLSRMRENKEIPGHMKFTYSQLPPKMGMTPSKYGTLPTQENEDLHGKDTWEDTVKKKETL
jgi:hypothetical protein